MKMSRFSLEQDGVTVIPCLTKEQRTTCLRYVKWDIHRYPELHSSTKRVTPIIGGFGAFGNPSSYHCRSVRKLRRRVYRAIKAGLQKELLDKGYRYIQLLFDRLSWRTPGTSVSGESFHRDVSPTCSSGEISMVTGGWLNLDSNSQYFSCIPGTHTKEGGYVPDDKSGFVKTTKEEAAELRKQRVAVEIPPGHIILFYNHLLHEVKATKQRVDGKGSYRLYCGIRASSDSKTPFDYEKDIADQASPILPSGDRPPMYTTRHLAFFKKRLIEFSERYKEVCLEEKTSKDGERYKVVKRFIPSLKSLSHEDTSIAMYTEYSEYDIEIMKPHRL